MKLIRKFKKDKADAGEGSENSGSAVEEISGLFELSDSASAGIYNVDIVAVHGLGGHWKTTWTADDKVTIWLQDRLPTTLQSIGVTPRIFSYGYDSAIVFSKAVTGIDAAAEMLLGRLQTKRKTAKEKAVPIVFIAHSLGGLVVKEAMILAWNNNVEYGPLLEKIKGCLFLGVPHRGADLAYWAQFPARVVPYASLGYAGNPRFLESLKNNSPTWMNISKLFVQRATQLKIRTFWETDKLGPVIVVDQTSASMNLPNEVVLPLAGSDHRTICKFGKKEDQRYEPISYAIEKLVQDSLGDAFAAFPKLIERIDALLHCPAASNMRTQNLGEDGDDRMISLTHTRAYNQWRQPGNWMWYRGTSLESCREVSSLMQSQLHDQRNESSKVVWVDCSATIVDSESERGPIKTDNFYSCLIAQVIQLDVGVWKRLQNGIYPFGQDVKITNVLMRSELCSDSEDFEAFVSALTRAGHEEVFLMLIYAQGDVDDPAIRFLSLLRRRMDGQAEHGLDCLRVLVLSFDETLNVVLRGVSVLAEDTEYKECLQSLFVAEQSWRRDRIVSPTPGTCDWIWNHPVYVNWNAETSGVLWIQGKPGSGKSVLAKHLQSQATANRVHFKTRLFDWFFEGRGTSVQKSTLSSFKSMLWQLLKNDPSLFQYATETYRKAAPESPKWTMHALGAILMRLADAGVPIFGIIDGLDESRDEHDNIQLDDLRFFASRLLRMTASSPSSRIKFIVLSRPTPEIRFDFMQCFQIVIDQENKDDICTVITSGLNEIQRKIRTSSVSNSSPQITVRGNRIGVGKRTIENRANERIPVALYSGYAGQNSQNLEEIRAHLLANADGVILWVVTILRILEDLMEKGIYSQQMIQEKLHSLPPRVDGLWARISSDLEKKLQRPFEVNISRGAFTWVTDASSFRALSLAELWDALAITVGIEQSGDEARFLEIALSKTTNPLLEFQPIHADYWSDVEERLYYLCGPLIQLVEPPKSDDVSETDVLDEIDPGQYTIQLAHQTVKDFLATSKSASWLNIHHNFGNLLVKANLYLEIALPAKTTPYLPLPVRRPNDWKSNVQAIVEYLDEKLLLTFALDMCEDFELRPSQASSSFWRKASGYQLPVLYTTMFDNIVSPPLSSRSDEDLQNIFEKELLGNYSKYRWHYSAGKGKYFPTGPEETDFEFIVVGQFFRYACHQGHFTAIRNLLALWRLMPSWRSRYGLAPFVGTLLVTLDTGIVKKGVVHDILLGNKPGTAFELAFEEDEMMSRLDDEFKLIEGVGTEEEKFAVAKLRRWLSVVADSTRQ